MYIRLLLLRNVGSDDYLIVISLFLGLVYCGITTANVAIGYGKHAYVLEQGTIELASLLNSLSFLFGILSFALPKLAVTAMLNRILNPSLIQRVWLWTLTGTAAVVSCVCITMLFTMCDPPEGLWKMHLVMEGKATCRDTWILINYAIFTGALSLGSIASAMAIIKCTQLKGLANKDDYTYGTADLVMWTNVESNIVIIASCIPTLQPVLELVLGRRTASSYNNSRNRYKDSSNMKDSSYTNKSSRPARKSDLKITKIESQESFLRGSQNEDAHPLGAIRRTDNVLVEYEVRGKGHGDFEERGSGGW
ncbi:hypothetical protein N8T08_010768 [Aspergillus melleus]|uniref:Uncharacterized protein n=1 Tax=Aspergillus melleus TaxID=138277 RepID=A0ACC3BCC7_9EURO|nr:hypothetical protein N8T08_010768 [Aspergillus melleus]